MLPSAKASLSPPSPLQTDLSNIKNKSEKQKYFLFYVFFLSLVMLCKGGGQKQRSHSCLFRNATILLSNTEPTRHIVRIIKHRCAGEKQKENKKRYRCCCRKKIDFSNFS